MDAAFLPSRKLVDLFFPPDQASLVENAISANQDWCSQTGVIWKVRSPFYSSFFLGRAFQIRSSTPHQIGQSALALTDFLSDGQASATRASSRWKLERGIGSSGEAQLLDLKTIQADVQRHKFTDAEKVQHVDSSCWMPVWVASLWEKADLPDEIVLGLNNSPNSEDRPLIESVSITSGMLEGNVMKSRASNLLEEITRLEASKQTSGSTLSAGDEPASPIVIAAVGGPRNCSQTSTEEGVVKTKERPFESSVQLSKPMPGQSFPGGTDLDDVTVHLSRIRTSADTVDMSGRHADSSPLSARDLPPGSPSSSRLGRTESTRAREMELKLALGGLHEDPVKALKEQPRRAAEIVMQTLRTPMQLHLQAFLGDLWREAVTDRRTALGLVKTIKQEFRHFRSALWRRRTDAEEVCLIIDTSISFLKRTILPGGPAIQEINGGIRALVSLLESFPAPEGLGTQYVKAEEDLRSGREQMEKIFAKVVDCESKMLQVGSLPISGYAFLQRSARASNVHTPRTPATQRTDSPEGPLEDLNGASAFKVSPEEKLAARPNSGSDARVDTIAETDDDRKQNAQQVVVQVSALSEQPVRKQPDESFLFMKPRLGIHMTEAGTLLLPGQLLGARVLAQQLRNTKDLPEKAIKRGSVQAKAVALALKECAISTPGFDDQEKAFTLYTSLTTFLDSHYENLLIAEFDQLTVEHVLEVGGDKDTVAELLHVLDF